VWRLTTARWFWTPRVDPRGAGLIPSLPGRTPGMNIDHALDWFLNSLNELGENADPVEDLASVIGNVDLARHLMNEFNHMPVADQVKFQKPCLFDVFQRECIGRWVDSYPG